MLKKCFIILIVLFVAQTGFGQEKTILFNEFRQLAADTNITINEESFEIWKEVEELILFKFINLYEPDEIISDIGLNSSCLFSFKYDSSSGFRDFHLLKFLDKYQNGTAFSKQLIQSVEKCFSKIENESIKRLMNKSNENMTYYIPLTFYNIDVNGFIDSLGTIKINKASTPLVKKNKNKR